MRAPWDKPDVKFRGVAQSDVEPFIKVGDLVEGQLVRIGDVLYIFEYFDSTEVFNAVPIVESTHGQYTDLVDKEEEQEICEGDLLQGDDGKVYEVTKENGCFGIKNIYSDDWWFKPLYEVCEEMKIIGNIHENKESWWEEEE